MCNIHGRSVRKMITYPPMVHRYGEEQEIDFEYTVSIY